MSIVEEILVKPIAAFGNNVDFRAFLIQNAALADLQEALTKLPEEQKTKRKVLQKEIAMRTTSQSIPEYRRRALGKENLQEWERVTALFRRK